MATFSALCPFLSLAQSPISTDTVSLDKGWVFCRADSKDNQWPASVPGVVQQDLIQQGVLPDPHYRMGEDSIQWIEQYNWLYTTNISIRPEQMDQHPSIRLLCEGLDTYAHIFVNGQMAGESDNMFVPLSINIKPWLHTGNNKIEILFRSPLSELAPKIQERGYQYPADNDHHPQRVSVYARKAPYHFGWDWGMRMLTIGPWRPIHLIFDGDIALERSIQCSYTLSPDLSRATVSIQAPLIVHNEKVPFVQRLRIYDPQGKMIREFEHVVHEGVAFAPTIALGDLPIQLWYPRGYGEQPLYKIELSIIGHDGRSILYETKQIGFRKVDLVREADEYGQSFYFKINNVPIFAKGANYIPTTHLLPTRTRENKDLLWQYIEAQHLNMIRVWGGGIYEDEDFYIEADRRGILIWQDFMFACTAYPADNEFLSNVRHEIRATMLRLGDHPAVVAWCGNNEVKEGLRYWGWQRKYTEQQYEGFVSDYDRLFRDVIPQTIEIFDTNARPYIESSPDTANWGRPSSLSLGESHYWGIWYGREPFESLSRRIPRFMSEFGVQSLPDIVSIRQFTQPSDRDLDSQVMKLHQKSSTGNEVILDYIRNYYREPKDFEDLCYLSQLMQARGIGYGMRAQRAARPYCMGSLYWQLGDVWPALSWSAIDYYNRPKALHYETKRAFAPVALFVDIEKFDPKASLTQVTRKINTRQIVSSTDSLYISIINDSCKLSNLSLKILPSQKTSSTDLEDCYKESRCLNLSHISIANHSVRHLSIPLEGFISKEDLPNTMLFISLKGDKDQEYASLLYCPLPPKDLINEASSSGIETSLSENSTVPNQWILKIQSRHPILGLAIEPQEGQHWIPSDNYFDLLPHETRSILIRSQDKPQFRLRHL